MVSSISSGRSALSGPVESVAPCTRWVNSPGGGTKVRTSPSSNETAGADARCGARWLNDRGSRLSNTTDTPSSRRSFAWTSDSTSHRPKKPVPPVMRSRASRRSRKAPRACSSTWSRSRSGSSDMDRAMTEGVDALDHVGEHLVREARMHTDPERTVHHTVAVGEIPDHAVADLLVRGLPHEVATEQQSRRDASRLEESRQRVTCERRVLAHQQRESEPARLGVRRRFGEDQQIFEPAQSGAQRGVVPATRLDEGREALELRHAHRSLHVGELQVVADVRVGVLVIVSERKVAQLPGEPLAAGVVLPRLAPAIASPITERLDEPLERRLLGEDAATFTHGDVVRRVEAHRRHVSEGAHGAARIRRTDGVAAV